MIKYYICKADLNMNYLHHFIETSIQTFACVHSQNSEDYALPTYGKLTTIQRLLPIAKQILVNIYASNTTLIDYQNGAMNKNIAMTVFIFHNTRYIQFIFFQISNKEEDKVVKETLKIKDYKSNKRKRK